MERGTCIFYPFIPFFQKAYLTFTSHQCGPDPNPDVDVICRLSLLLVLCLAPRGFSPGITVFSLLKNQHFQIPIRSGTHRHISVSSLEL